MARDSGEYSIPVPAPTHKSRHWTHYSTRGRTAWHFSPFQQCQGRFQTALRQMIVSGFGPLLGKRWQQLRRIIELPEPARKSKHRSPTTVWRSIVRIWRSGPAAERTSRASILSSLQRPELQWFGFATRLSAHPATTPADTAPARQN